MYIICSVEFTQYYLTLDNAYILIILMYCSKVLSFEKRNEEAEAPRKMHCFFFVVLNFVYLNLLSY